MGRPASHGSVKSITVRNIFMQAQIAESLNKVQKWVEDHDYKGYEPFDSLSFWLAPLLRWNLFAERVLQQLLRRSPINLRPLLGIKPHRSPKLMPRLRVGKET